ncbi:MAG: hypothetical protein EZS28_007181 [Streblomastix strix]|uniref:Uncharacterized protein n=1 Tax=Streblomastix strix TaxID=222440 RepID=A0A5J4WR85_9EUKA|nr:MAG: hypothetical protein EZS28_007181 [Streblomastix strix]
MSDINANATAAEPPFAPKTEYYYLIPEDITFTNKKLRIIIFITLDVGLPAKFKSQKPNIVYQMRESEEGIINYERYTVRIVNMSGSAADAKELQQTIIRVLFDDNPDSQVLSMEIIGETGGSMVRSG